MVTRAFLSGTSDTAKSFVKVEKVESMEWTVKRSPPRLAPRWILPRGWLQRIASYEDNPKQTKEFILTLYSELYAQQKSTPTFCDEELHCVSIVAQSLCASLKERWSVRHFLRLVTTFMALYISSGMILIKDPEEAASVRMMGLFME